MAAHVDLSQRDMNVLEKMRDPDFNPAASLILDERLPRDPHLTDPDVYERTAARERTIVASLQALEAELAQSQDLDADERAVAGYREAVAQLSALVDEHPRYASARNNRAQAARRLYGDLMLLDVTTTSSGGAALPLILTPRREEKREAAARALEDLERSIALLTPAAPSAAPFTCRRAGRWQPAAEAASHDLALGGRYGNDIAKNLAVSVNPTAKLCGQIVREAMRKEYGPGFMPPEPEE
ncbi:hypothetical protein ISF_04889 [Cordyceps fumosorosea ARSEF 2679]|uniref:Uncharacterized protein n=1 Tax=Cordyceps fumosorosea (strain ARSEF 2679) TaxID=1081104 RepID=A0A167VV52_CORFA|nr:hypothetical protein ISF_04889 [Cordyceps fumosorosea ARSEF 2679]OAA63013.1 hypothetical protein ISF_04889 [Cordyceps fumosorosea ARSEF 2679]